MVEALVRTQGQLLEADPSSKGYSELLQRETDIRIGEHDYDLDYQLWSVIPRSIAPTHEEIVRDFSIMGDKHSFELKEGSKLEDWIPDRVAGRAHLEGWIIDVIDGQLEFYSSGIFATDDLIPIPAIEVDIRTLEYLEEKRWGHAIWNPTSLCWTHQHIKDFGS